ncbi:MAG: phosphatidate cytidylyltransferase [Deltaproteobacteria bacterium]|nr:phosphatidate cytidylyltransferase [Deltaproteobacteria bacterium]
MLRTRLLTAAILLPLLVAGLAYIPHYVLFPLLLVLCFGASYEAVSLLMPTLRSRLGDPMKNGVRFWAFFCASLAALMFTVLTWKLWDAELGILAFLIMTMLLVATFSVKTVDGSIANGLSWLFSVIYGSLPFVSLWELYKMGDHSRYLFLVLGIVMANDTGAFFAGRFLGKHLLLPRLSPKKTWEGVVGGLAGGILGAWFVNACFAGNLGSLSFLAFLGLITGAAGILGDLAESAIKRFAGVKDSGRVFPGHGGILDRSDSVVFAAPIAWFMLFIRNA